MASILIAVVLLAAYLCTLVLGTCASYGKLYDRLYGNRIGL